ncbi:hypothetical protein PCANC_16837 [Puccinia coronata f. sp. avenae]|uniref:Uncharacterized protein n=1 Tax=Puccinia coronata f. sp. avenae TaxID=200324 RepID=A0A2N5SJN8_9BASI|nr:hypothetical protein PCANC_16837 [Puccinia coronata f. sp. avenae]
MQAVYAGSEAEKLPWRASLIELEIGLSRLQNDTLNVVIHFRRKQDVEVVME